MTDKISMSTFFTTAGGWIFGLVMLAIVLCKRDTTETNNTNQIKPETTVNKIAKKKAPASQDSYSFSSETKQTGSRTEQKEKSSTAKINREPKQPSEPLSSIQEKRNEIQKLFEQAQKIQHEIEEETKTANRSIGSIDDWIASTSNDGLRQLLREADTGNKGAAYRAAMMYYSGIDGTENMEANYKKAFILLSQAAEGFNPLPEAVNQLAECYASGIGTEKDIPKAVECYKKMASDGNSGAMNNAAWFMAVYPDDSVWNPEEAMYLARNAVEKDPSPWNIDTLTAVYARNNQFDEAVKGQEKVVDILIQQIKNHPEQHRNLHELAEAAHRLNLYKNKQVYLENNLISNPNNQHIPIIR